MKVVIINGSAGVGKDTFCAYVTKYCRCMSFSSVDRVKQMARLCGWDGVKDEKSRKFLSDLKKITTEFNDMPMKYMEEMVLDGQYSNMDVVFLHIREPEEIERAKEAFKANTLLVINRNIIQITSNSSDANVYNYKYDYTIDNSGSLEDLDKAAEEFANLMKGE